MNKLEISEIKRQFNIDRFTIDNICICYVGSEKEKKFVTKDAFGSLPEEEMHKYLKFLKKGLSGTIGKNLMNLDFPLSEEMNGGKQEFLLKVRDSHLNDDDLLDEYFDRIIAQYDSAEKYCIIVVHAVYDIPGKGSDRILQEDASEDVFDHFMTLLCPVELRDGELGYDPKNNRIGELEQDWVLHEPDKAFLFPSFNDRTTDIHSILYYSRKCEEIQPDFINFMFGLDAPLTAGDQKDTFNMLVSGVCGDEGDVEVMKNIHDSLSELIEENKENPDPLVLSKPDVKKIFNDSGVSPEKMEAFEERYEDIAGDEAEIMVSNISGIKSFKVSTPDIEIKVKPDYLDRIEARIVDGKECLVITVDDRVEVNGVNVRTLIPRSEKE